VTGIFQSHLESISTNLIHAPSMHYTSSIANSKLNSALQRIHQASERDGEKLSPVDLSIRAASRVLLPPLTWANYHHAPAHMTVTNTGYTVLINAVYERGTPSVSSGPLAGQYIFSQVHFHWGQHNRTGSGHAVDGNRYPLEMHVVHHKNEYPNLGAALDSKDGVAVMVHLFELGTERSPQLDQLSAVLQFIHTPRSCARLYPTPLAELVQPFSSDYFLYWGCVRAPRGQCRILWLVSRTVLPVSSHQLDEFRQLYDPAGNKLVSNSNKPSPLSGRSLFLVSPSDVTDQTMCGVSAEGDVVTDSEGTLEAGHAEYRSLANLEDADNECRICPGPKRVRNIGNIQLGKTSTVQEGDTSIEESCINLNNMSDSGVTIKTEMKYRDNPKCQKLITNVNVTRCRHKCKIKPTPSEAVYSVISARGPELHLKRKPFYVRQNEPSTEEACVILGNNLSPRSSYSAPSLTSTGPLMTKQEYTQLYSKQGVNTSDEVAVLERDSDHYQSQPPAACRGNPTQIQHSYTDEYEKERKLEEKSKSLKTTKKVTIVGFEDNKNAIIDNSSIKLKNFVRQQGKDNHETGPSNNNVLYNNERHQDYTGYYMSEEKENIKDKSHSKYMSIQETTKRPPAIRDDRLLGQQKNLNTTINNSTKYIDDNSGETNVGNQAESCKTATFNSASKENKHGVVNGNQYTEMETKEYENESHFRVNLLVRTTVSDHRKPGKSKGKGPQKYVVTKITPIEQNQSVTHKDPNSQNTDVVFYAKPIFEESPGKDTQRPIQEPDNYDKEICYKNIYYEKSWEDIQNKNTREKHVVKKIQEHMVNNNNVSFFDENKSNQMLNSKNVISNKEDCLLKTTNIYHGKNNPDEDVLVVDKTITGKIGENNSIDVFLKSKKVELINPKKTDISKKIDYDLIRSKHPPPEYYIKEPLNKTQPRAIITQNLSLDQQVQGHSQVRQSVEYHDNKRPKIVPRNTDVKIISDKQHDLDRNETVTEMYDESCNEHSSRLKTFQHKTYRQIRERQSTESDANDQRKVSSKTILQEPLNELKGKEQIEYNKLDSSKTFVTNDDEKSKHNFSRTYVCKDEELNEYNHEKSRHVNKKFNYLKEKKQDTAEEFENGKSCDNEENISKLKLPNIKEINTEIEKTPSKNDRKDLIPCNKNVGIPSLPENSKQNKTIIQDNEEVEISEIVEEEEQHTIHKKRGTKVTTQAYDESYRFPDQSPRIPEAPSSEEIIVIKKVEVPEPHYITRIPKQPLVEYEAYLVDPHQPFEIITENVEEISSVVKTNRTFMMFKKINGKAVLNQPSIIEPMQMRSSERRPPIPALSTKNSQTKEQTSEKNVNIEESTELNNKKLTSTMIEVPKLNNAEIKEPTLKQTSDQQTSVQSNIKTSSHYKRTGNVRMEYEYSETSLLSQKKHNKTEKKYIYKMHNVSENGSDSPLKMIQNNNNMAILNDFEKNTLNKGSNPVMTISETNCDVNDIKENDITNNMENQGSSTKDTSILPTENKNNDSTVKNITSQTLDRPGYFGNNYVLNEDYFESSTRDKHYKSNIKRVVLIRKDGTHENKPNNKFLFNKQPLSLDKNTDLRADTSKNNKETNRNNIINVYKQQEKGNTDILKTDLNKNKHEQQLNVTSNPIEKDDGDLVIYFRQPKQKSTHISPEITVDVTKTHQLSPSELDNQQVHVHEIKPGVKIPNKKKIVPRKSKSAEILHSSTGTETSEDDVALQVDSNEEQVIDTTHYNLTLKSETRVLLPADQSAQLISKAGVKITPVHKAGGPTLAQTEDTRAHSAADRISDHSSYTQSTSFEESTQSNDSSFNQSPIQINTKTSVVKKCLPLEFINHWNVQGDALLANNGKTLRGSCMGDTGLPCLRGGPLNGDYIFIELHFHWGPKDCCGAEHMIDDQRFTLEAHYLYYKEEYGGFKEALQHADGIAAVAVTLETGGPPNPVFGTLVRDLPLIREADTGVYVPAESLFSWIKPTVQEAKGYFSYKGTLTLYPPFVEAVTWIIFPEPVIFCCQQSREFRQLKDQEGELVKRNYRSPQPLNSRTVYYIHS